MGKKIIKDLLKSQGNRCGLCGKFCSLAEASRDHLIPRSWGGSNHWNNQIAAHRSCNNKKGDKAVDPFFYKQRALSYGRNSLDA